VRDKVQVKGATKRVIASGSVAAFFDLDGTLAAEPSLERRFLRVLRYRREAGVKNLWSWAGEAMRLAPQGIGQIVHANKMYLRGVEAFEEREERAAGMPRWHRSSHQAEEHAAPQRHHPRLPAPVFFAEAVERAAWHAQQGHEIVIVSGTLEPLAREAARALTARLAARGMAAEIGVRATRLEEKDRKWTGKIAGEAMFGEAKARAIRRLAAEKKFNLANCFAYGDSASDRWMLEAVGRPAAVNPSSELARIARRNGWAVLRWEEYGTQRRRGRREEREETEANKILMERVETAQHSPRV
jgi:alcohol-forming fatty acyl-CoA reductase